jgi:Transcription antiterminator
MAVDDGLHWFVANTKYCCEKKAAQVLEARGVEYYLPVQKVVRQWSDRRKVIDKMVLPRMIFVRTTEAERVKLKNTPYITSFMVKKGPYTPVIVPEDQLETFRRVVEGTEEDITVTDEPIMTGDKVEVVSGPLSGYQFEVALVSGKRCLAVRLGDLCAVTVDISANKLHKIL